MKNHATRLDLDFLATADDPIAKHLISDCIRRDYLIDEKLGRYSERLVLLDGNPLTLDSPRILFGGSETLASTEFGFDWPKTPVSPGSVFSDTYRRLTAEGYKDCINYTQVVVEHIECRDAMATDDRPVSYSRAVFPITNGQGAWFIGVYSFNSRLARYPTAFEEAERHRQDRILRNTNLHKPYLPVATSI
ncbi:hypothetical protein [uncultured Roseibium sp.]|uniref:hypothetical protein n=1 Tax=uncultured Roseibium sp. TaxID=1936171 RepID=UPI00260AAA2E|nr:hypothetical protein [uncultured Roseibium sp.]